MEADELRVKHGVVEQAGIVQGNVVPHYQAIVSAIVCIVDVKHVVRMNTIT